MLAIAHVLLLSYLVSDPARRLSNLNSSSDVSDENSILC
jgi:hypothetical protein